jgi:CubicO group peptidase (beta-lactamase class C family)
MRDFRHIAPPRADWDRAPWNRWSFQHIREILPTTEVWRGYGPEQKLAYDLQDIERIIFEDDGKATDIGTFLNDSFTDGFMVLSKGKVIAERYMNNMQARSLHLSQSMAKSVTATAFGVLVGQGLIDPEALISDYLPELAETGWRGAKLQHSLDMTSGVAYDEDYTAFDSDMAKTDVAAGWKNAATGHSWPENIWAQILTLTKQARPHGERFEYRSIETDVLAFVMQAVTGKPLEQIVSECIWQKIGAAESACFTVDKAGYALADGGFNATLADYARFGLLWARRGNLNGEQIIPKSWVDATIQGDGKKFHAPYNDIFPHGAYRNQFWIDDVRQAKLLCRGVFGQLIYIDAENDFVAVKLSSWPEFLSPSRSRSALLAVQAISYHFS